jgi:hypothetical protein
MQKEETRSNNLRSNFVSVLIFSGEKRRNFQQKRKKESTLIGVASSWRQASWRQAATALFEVVVERGIGAVSFCGCVWITSVAG